MQNLFSKFYLGLSVRKKAFKKLLKFLRINNMYGD